MISFPLNQVVNSLVKSLLSNLSTNLNWNNRTIEARRAEGANIVDVFFARFDIFNLDIFVSFFVD